MRLFYHPMIVLVVFLSLILSSCEEGYNYSYRLFNNTDSIISVDFKTRFKDSTIVVAPKENKEILSTLHGLEGFGGPFESDVKQDFIKILIKKGTKKTINNYRENKFWTFLKKNSNEAVYKTVLTNADF